MRRRLGGLAAAGLLVLGLDGPAHATPRFQPPEALTARWKEGRFEAASAQGFSWLRATTDGKGSPAFAATAQALAPALDLRGKFLRVWVRVEDVSQLAGMELRLSSDGFATSYFSFAVPLFADDEFNFVHSGPWTTLTFSFGAAQVVGAPDRSRIDGIGWVVRDQGKKPVIADYGGAWFEDEPAQAVVSLTFDDGYDEHFLVAAPAMKKHGFRGTAYVMPEQVGLGGYMTLEQLRALRESYGWDVAAHHDRPFTSFPPEELERTILGVRRFLVSNGFGRGAAHLAFPLGKQEPDHVLPLTREHFLTARVASGGPETLPPADWHQLRAYNVLRTTTPDEVQAAVRRAKQHKEWLILMLHWLVDAPTRDTEYTPAGFEEILRRIAAEKVDVRPVSEVWHAAN